MKAKLIITGTVSLLIGGAAGAVGGYFYAQKACEKQVEEQTASIRTAYQEKYDRDLKVEANRMAKDIIFRAQKLTSQPFQPNASAEDGGSGDGVGEQPDPGDSDGDADRAGVVRHNAFAEADEAQQDPTMPVDYQKFSQNVEFTGRAELNANLLRSEAAESSGANPEVSMSDEEKELLAADEAADRAIETESTPPAGYPETPMGLRKGCSIISEQDYDVGNPRFEKSFLIYFALDGVWADEDQNKLEDAYYTVGCPDDMVFRAAEAEDPDRVFIRNVNIGCDFECVRYHRSYYDSALDVK